MKCNNCGKVLNENDEYCNRCGISIKEAKKARLLCILSLFFTYSTFFLYILIEELNIPSKIYDKLYDYIFNVIFIFPIIGLVLIIYARIKYKNYRMTKTILTIYIVTFLLVLFIIAYAIISCELNPPNLGTIFNML